jgi:hypothetical protein
LITSPIGGEAWEAGTTHNITWNGTAINSVKIEFTSNNGTDWTTIANNLPGSGSYAWNLPNTNSTQCKIRVSDATDGVPSDVSGFAFTIKPISTLSVISPKAGDVYSAGSPVNIQWTSNGIQNVKIEFTTNNGLIQADWFSLIDNTPSNGNFITTFSIPSNQYRIRISEALTGSPMAYSDGVFTISPQPVRTINMAAPIGGEQWIVGTTNEIRWFSTNIDSVKLEYTLDGGADWNTIAAKVPSNGLYNWLVPSVEFRSDNCYIRVSDAKLGTPSAMSLQPFSIYSSKVLKLLTPNGGDSLVGGGTIRWISSGIQNVNIEFSIDNGQPNGWVNIVSNFHSTGLYEWQYSGPESRLARVRIYDSSDPTITDMSDSTFNLFPGPLKLFYPIGNNTYSASSGINITWKGINTISSVKIEYSSDNGKSWNIIAGNVPNGRNKVNNYLWSDIPQSIKGNILIRLSDSKGRYSDKSGIITIN